MAVFVEEPEHETHGLRGFTVIDGPNTNARDFFEILENGLCKNLVL
jgi:hypothetical protein